MLPGFRFLFAAIMLSMSLLIFGLGAAALFRAAHESFASNSSWRATPDVPFAQRPDTTLPMLATLRVEPVAVRPLDTARVAAAPAEPAPAISESVATDRLAALHPAEPLAAETARADIAKPEIAKPADMPATSADRPAPAAEIPPAVEAAPPAPASAEAAAAAETKTETTTAAVAHLDAASVKDEPVVVDPEPAAPTTGSTTATLAAEAPPETPATPAEATTPEADSAMTRIATLGGPPVDVADETPAIEPRLVKIPRARPDESAIKKRQQARRALRRRRLLAARARLLALQQLQANPFAQQQFPQPQQNVATAIAAAR